MDNIITEPLQVTTNSEDMPVNQQQTPIFRFPTAHSPFVFETIINQNQTVATQQQQQQQQQQPFLFTASIPPPTTQQHTPVTAHGNLQKGSQDVEKQKRKRKFDMKSETKIQPDKKETEKELEFLQLIHSNMSMMPSSLLLQYENLRTLELSHNKIENVNLPYHCKITHLFMSYNNINTIDMLPKDLVFLDLGNNRLVNLPSMEKYERLSKIIVSNNNILTINQPLPNSLQHFECNNNRLRFCHLMAPQLKYVNVSENSLEDLKFNSSYLQYLNCSSNMYLDELPFLTLSLKYLNISNTCLLLTTGEAELADKVVHLPDSIEILNINGCDVEILPELPSSLITLHCNDCGIREANHLWKLKQVAFIDCSRNNLHTLRVPVSLKKLYCQENILQVLDIPYISSLTFVNCSTNRIKSFRHIPHKITSIKSFLCLDNPLFFLPRLSSFHRPYSLVISIEMLKRVVRSNNVAFVVSNIVGQPMKYKHLINNWGEIHDKLQKKWLRIQTTSCNECPICFNTIPFFSKCFTECDHVFCITCMNELKRNNTPNCPMCRNALFWKPFSEKAQHIRMMMDCKTKKERGGGSFHISRPYETAPTKKKSGILFSRPMAIPSRMYTYTCFIPEYRMEEYYDEEQQEEQQEEDEEQEDED
jgi:hypothetical protein